MKNLLNRLLIKIVIILVLLLSQNILGTLKVHENIRNSGSAEIERTYHYYIENGDKHFLTGNDRARICDHTKGHQLPVANMSCRDLAAEPQARAAAWKSTSIRRISS